MSTLERCSLGRCKRRRDRAPENAACEGATALARDEHVSAGCAFGKYQVTVFLDDELASQRDHEEHAEPSAEESQRKDSPKGEFGAEAEKNQRGNREHDAGGERFAGWAGGLDDVVFEDGGTAESAKNADGEHGNGDRSGNGEPGAQADVDSHRAEKQSEERAKDHRANGKFLGAFFGRHVSAEFTRGCRGTPWTFAH